MNVTDETGKNAGVRNSAPVVIAGAYATSSYKAVEEKDMPEGETNRTDSSGLINYILLPGKNKEFTYTLTVNNDNTGKYSIGNCLLYTSNISSLAEKGGQITEIIPTLSSEDKAETKAPSEESDEIPDETETMPIETDPAGEPEEENKNTSSVILHTPSNTENTEQTGESDTSGDPEDEATPSDADEDLINDLIDDRCV